ncbi:glycosyltransferase family 4 protein [Pontibacter russatus]|uniref:glycosyltransferase family 4 protein n=1 Tax=Pontibacter russatus TaxID=2694929 RepID=UPI00137AD990|nr:glycosyltransferase family 4 protein [Pontibacter russatus]
MKHKKRILITIDWFLPGYKAGGPIQSCANLIANLKEEYDFWVITRNTDYTSDEPYADVPANKWHQLEQGVQVYYFSESHLSYASLKEIMQSVLVDVVYINGIFSKYFSIMPLLIARKNKLVPVVIAARGMFAPGAVDVKPGKKKAFFFAAKWLGLYKGITFHATNAAEEEYIHAKVGKRVKVVIAPNLPKSVKNGDAHPAAPKQQGVLKLVSVARISPEKNTDFALQVLNDKAYAGKIIFDIYGPVNEEFYWKECQQLIENLPANIAVTYHGSLPSSEVSATLSKYHALFLPTRGENFGHVILESLAAGLPVIISDQTPWRGLEALHVGYDLPLADWPRFSAAIQQMLALDQDSFNRMSGNALQFARRFIQDEALVAANKALFA